RMNTPPSNPDTELLVAAQTKRCLARHNECEREHAGEKTFSQKVNVLGRNEVQHRDFFDASGINEPFQGIATNNERSEKRGENAKAQRNGETFDRPARCPE